MRRPRSCCPRRRPSRQTSRQQRCRGLPVAALSCQPVGVLTNTYARPNPEERTDIAGAPTTMLLPDTATESPNQSGPLVSGLFNSALSCQPVAVLTKTYARPKPEERRGAAGAPTTVVVLDTATEAPNQSPGTVPEPASSASCLPTGGAARWPATAHAGPALVTPGKPVNVPAATTAALTRLFSLTVSFCATCSQGRNVMVLGGHRSRLADTP